MQMPLDLATLMTAARASIEEPRQGARWVLQMNLPLANAVQALVVVAILNGLMSYFVIQLALAGGEDVGYIALSPLNMALFQGLGMFVMAAGAHLVGRWFGGTGQLNGAMVLVAWMQFILLLVQIIQLAITSLLPFFAMPITAVVIAASLWLLVNFIAELHGFASLFKVLAGIFATGFTIILLISVWAAMLVTPGG
jgi:hypothetical protein